jgi:hypothetical protein
MGREEICEGEGEEGTAANVIKCADYKDADQIQHPDPVLCQARWDGLWKAKEGCPIQMWNPCTP